jgi:hypothetical protein
MKPGMLSILNKLILLSHFEPSFLNQYRAMPEEQDIPKQAPDQEEAAKSIVQDLTDSPSQTQTPDMEVHHHPDVEKKGIKEYLLEGLMIFLAVTMGFIAENIREHITEHKNAKILAESMLEDIKKDTASLHNIIAFSTKKLDATDSILTMMHRPRGEWDKKGFYKNMVPVMTAIPFAPTDGTYAQMKTSGSLRYFNQSLVNLMNSYDVQIKKTEYRDNVEDKGIWILANMNFDVMNLEVISDMRFNKPIQHDMYIKIGDETSTDKFINLIVMNKVFRTRTLMEYEEQLKIGVRLIEAIQKEYHLE